MAQKMTLTAYLAQRGVKAKALTKGEADLLGIPYPLRAGWPKRYGAMEIEGELLTQLEERATAARDLSEKKARRDRPNGAGQTWPPRAAASTAAELSRFPGFVLRQARRYRSRSSAPWA